LRPSNKPLQQPNATPTRSMTRSRRDAAGKVPAATRGRDTLERDLGVRCFHEEAAPVKK